MFTFYVISKIISKTLLHEKLCTKYIEYLVLSIWFATTITSQCLSDCTNNNSISNGQDMLGDQYSLVLISEKMADLMAVV